MALNKGARHFLQMHSVSGPPDLMGQDMGNAAQRFSPPPTSDDVPGRNLGETPEYSFLHALRRKR